MEKSLIEHLGGRKNSIGYLFLLCTTFLVYTALKSSPEPKLLELATVIGAMATGVGALVWGNIKEWQAKSETTKTNGNGETKA